MNIKKTKNNYDKDRKSRYFKCNIYRYITKNCRKPKKKKKTRKHYKYDKVRYLIKNCRLGQKIKNRSIQENSNDKNKENNNKKKGFVRDLEQRQYNEPLYIVNF